MSSDFCKATQLGGGRAGTGTQVPIFIMMGPLSGTGVKARHNERPIPEEILAGIENPTHEDLTVMNDFQNLESVSGKAASFNLPSQKE